MSSTQQRDRLLQELEADAAEYSSGGRFNNIADTVLSIVAILTSLIATVLAGAITQKWLVAAFAAMPAACASAQRVIDIKGRSDWYFRFATRLRSLATTLQYADAPNVPEAARKRGELEEEMERDWAKVGRSGMTPTPRKYK
jgi:hypothetical protein